LLKAWSSGQECAILLALRFYDRCSQTITIALLLATAQEKTLRSLLIYVIYADVSTEEVFMRRSAVLAVCFLLLTVSTARAEFYRWVDTEGREFFTNDLETVPQEYRARATMVKPDDSRVSVGQGPIAASRPSEPLKEQKDKYGKGEEHWRKRSAKLRKELSVLQDKYDLVLKKERENDNKTGKLSARNSGKNKKAQGGRENGKVTLERDIARKKHELEVELPDEARKAGAYPGWLRE
jgi:hypothetical protein